MNDRQVETYKRNFTGDRVEEAMTLSELTKEVGLYNMEYIVDQCDSWKQMLKILLKPAFYMMVCIVRWIFFTRMAMVGIL